MKLPALLHRDVGHAGAARGRRRRPTSAWTPSTCSPFAGAEEALFWAMQELVGPGDHAVVTVPCYQAMETVTAGDRRRRERPGAAPRERLGARPRRAARSAAPEHEARRRQLPEQPDRLRARRGDLPRARGAVRRARHPPLLRRGLPRHRGRPGADAHAGGRPLRDGRLAQRGLQVLRPSRSAHRLARLPRPRRCSSASRSASTTRRSATPARRSTCRRSRSAIASPSGSATAASSPPTGRCSTTSSPAGPSSSTGSRRWAGASASRGTRAATSRTSAAQLLDAEGVLVLPASIYYSEIADDAGRPLPCRTRPARPRGGPRGVRPVPAGTELNSLQEGDFGPGLSVTCCRLPAALILGASGSGIYLVDAPRLRSYRGALGGTHTRSCGRTADCVQGGSKCRKSCTSR